MKIVVASRRCQGHARCAAIAPAIFRLDESGYILPGDIEVKGEAEALALRGTRACPERALSVVKEERP